MYETRVCLSTNMWSAGSARVRKVDGMDGWMEPWLDRHLPLYWTDEAMRELVHLSLYTTYPLLAISFSLCINRIPTFEACAYYDCPIGSVVTMLSSAGSVLCRHA